MSTHQSEQPIPAWIIMVTCVGSILFMHSKLRGFAPPIDIEKASHATGYVLGIVVTALLMGRRLLRSYAGEPGSGPGADVFLGWVTYWIWGGFTRFFPPETAVEGSNPWHTYRCATWTVSAFDKITDFVGLGGLPGLLCTVGILGLIGALLLGAIDGPS